MKKLSRSAHVGGNKLLTPNRLGILSMILCLATGISAIFSFTVLLIIIGVISMYVSLPNLDESPSLANSYLNSVFAFLILFIEVPLLLRICPTSSKFDNAIRQVSTNYMRAAAYAVMSVVVFLSLLNSPSALIAAAVFLALTALCYLAAGIKGQAFVGSKTLGGQGVAQMIV